MQSNVVDSELLVTTLGMERGRGPHTTMDVGTGHEVNRTTLLNWTSGDNNNRSQQTSTMASPNSNSVHQQQQQQTKQQLMTPGMKHWFITIRNLFLNC